MCFIVRKFALFSPQIEFLLRLNPTHGKATLTWFKAIFEEY
ncbi:MULTISPECIES: hypothetical protein [Streptococcus]|nr:MULTISPECIES: hypothetical protein [Streptococcus]